MMKAENLISKMGVYNIILVAEGYFTFCREGTLRSLTDELGCVFFTSKLLSIFLFLNYCCYLFKQETKDEYSAKNSV